MAGDADIKAADRGETADIMEPLLLDRGSRHRADITDLASCNGSSIIYSDVHEWKIQQLHFFG